MLKKIITNLIVSFSVICSSQFIAFADDFSNNSDYDVIFIGDKEIKVSSEMSEYDRNKLISIFQEIPTLSTDGVFTDVNESITIFTNDNSNDISTRSVIPQSTLTLEMIQSNVSTGSRSRYNIQAVAIWKNSPVIKSKDQFALSWAGDFATISYSSNSYWKSGGQGVQVSSPLSNIIPNAGISYEYQCGSDDNNFEFDPWYIQINATLDRAKTTGSNPVNVVASYAHKTTGLGSISVNFSPGSISFSASFGCQYDTASPISTLIYY